MTTSHQPLLHGQTSTIPSSFLLLHYNEKTPHTNKNKTSSFSPPLAFPPPTPSMELRIAFFQSPCTHPPHLNCTHKLLVTVLHHHLKLTHTSSHRRLTLAAAFLPTHQDHLVSSSQKDHLRRNPTSNLVLPHLGTKDTSLESTWEHRLWVAAACSALVGVLYKAAQAAQSPEDAISALIAATAAYVLADLGTGIYHWGIDNYGNATTPVFGSQIDAFQGHHKRPWTITKRKFANNIYTLARPTFIALLPMIFLPSDSVVDVFAGVFLGCIVFSQQFHAWAHAKKSELPAMVILLQEMGILVSRNMHGAHHRLPYDNNYCIVSGLWNPLLDKGGLFRKLEMVIYLKWGVKPRCWSESIPQWVQEGSYFADGTDLDSSL